ncbi:UDP-N-acetylglucosamine/UDP-N-acetylgalactosamine diphosphorylase [Nematocida ausubeli]|nr:UDP-N-acetylglucosamine/UDP-N-acetylgalactosamine diphosphorylase [Nematocida ausubeli]
MHLLLETSPERKSLEEIGRSLIEKKSVAVLTLAGGSGSRLGYEHPKGTFVLPTKKKPGRSLFQRQAEKIFKAGAPWVIMVSNETKDKTIEHLQTVVLPEYDMKVFLIVQEDIDALDKETKNPLLNMKGDHIQVPNGNGSVFKTLKASSYIAVDKDSVTPQSMSLLSALPDTKYFNIISIDNVLVRIADPGMVGYAQKYLLEVVSAGVPEMPNKKMGVFELINGRIEVTEYTSEEKRGLPLVNSDEKNLANIANHLVAKECIERMDPEEIPYHEAIKKIPHAGDPSPSAPNAIKRELFIFDGFRLANSHGVIEYGCNSYEGLKNKEGESDSIETCTRAVDEE